MPGLGGGSGIGAGAVRAGRAFVEFFAQDGALLRSMDRIKKRLSSFAGSAVRVGTVTGTAGAAALTPVLAAVQGLNDIAKQGSIATALGLTSEQFTGIAGVAKSVGEDTREFIESLVTLGKVASEGAAGKGEVAAEFFKGLNVEAGEFASLRADEQFFAFFEAVQKVEDPLKRVRYLMTAFGEDGGKFLLPLLEKTPEELRKMAKGFAVSAADMKAARVAQAAYIDATTGIGRAWRAVVIALAPAVSQIAAGIATVARPVAALIDQNRGVVTTALAVAAGLTAAGVAIAGFGLALSVVGTAFGVVVAGVKLVVAAIGTLLTPVGLATAAVLLLARHWATATESGKAAAGELRAAFEGVGETFRTMFQGVTDAVRAGNLELAFKILAAGVEAVWYRMLSAMGKAFAQFVRDNHNRLVVLGTILGGVKGAMIGSRFGPWGTLIGGAAGGAAGGFGADEVATMLEGFGHTPGVDAAAAAAEKRLRELAIAAGKAAVADPAEIDRKRMEAELKKHAGAMRLFDAAKGSFTVPAAIQQFGYGDRVGGTVEQKQLAVQQKIDKNTAAAVRQLVDLSTLFRMG